MEWWKVEWWKVGMRNDGSWEGWNRGITNERNGYSILPTFHYSVYKKLFHSSTIPLFHV